MKASNKMTFQSDEEQQIIGKFLNRNNLFVHGLVSIDMLKAFLRNILVYKTNLIRLGAKNDGGYLVPDDLDNISCCFSPGVDSTIYFEKDLAKKKIPSYLLDSSIDKLPETNDLFHFEKKFLGISNNDKFININSWIRKSCPIKKETDFILQMDIEGCEYEVLLDFEKELMKRFRILVIEFHFLYNIINPIIYRIINSVFEKILENFYIVHIHPNNYAKPMNILGHDIPNVMEFTFLRKDRLNDKTLVSKLPHNLDRKNIEENEDVVLPSYWYNNI